MSGCNILGFTRPGEGDIWRTKQRGQPHPEDHDAHPVTAAVWKVPSHVDGRFNKGTHWVPGTPDFTKMYS